MEIICYGDFNTYGYKPDGITDRYSEKKAKILLVSPILVGEAVEVIRHFSNKKVFRKKFKKN